MFRRDGGDSRQQVGTSLSTAQRRVMTAIETCRTAALGGHVEQCDACGHQRIAYNSCANRHLINDNLASRPRALDAYRKEQRVV